MLVGALIFFFFSDFRDLRTTTTLHREPRHHHRQHRRYASGWCQHGSIIRIIHSVPLPAWLFESVSMWARGRGKITLRSAKPIQTQRRQAAGYRPQTGLRVSSFLSTHFVCTNRRKRLFVHYPIVSALHYPRFSNGSCRQRERMMAFHRFDRDVGGTLAWA